MTARRRFYKSVTVTPELGIALDGRSVKTPMKSALQLPTQALAEAVAAEWDAQRETIEPASMILTKLANTAIDRVAPGRAPIEAEVLDYAGSDLICYRADRPPELVARQTALWDPVLDWARTALDAPYETTLGITHRPQPEAALKAYGAALKDLNTFELAAAHTVMTLTGSALITLMLARQVITAEQGWQAAHVDEDYQIAQWGEDSEAAARRAVRQAEYLAACRFMTLARV